MSDNEEFAPSFDDARNMLANLLDGWVFGQVTREVKRPDICKPYFHGMIVTHKKARVWFQETNCARTSLRIGPIIMRASTEVPRAGDVIMGREETSTQGERRKSRLTTWYANAQPLQMLARVCLEGTYKNEMQLMGEMRSASNDDVWALCRLVLFGNIRAFADAHGGKRGGMKLSTTPLEFVHYAAETLGDETIWDAFVALVPDATPPSSGYDSDGLSPPTTPSYNPPLPSYDPMNPPLPSYDPMNPPAPLIKSAHLS